jgi:hypothetical protein
MAPVIILKELFFFRVQGIRLASAMARMMPRIPLPATLARISPMPPSTILAASAAPYDAYVGLFLFFSFSFMLTADSAQSLNHLRHQPLLRNYDVAIIMVGSNDAIR